MNWCPECGSFAINDDPQRKLCDRCWRDAEIERLQAGLVAVTALIAESHGVAGLHKNGEIAPWDDLLAGGRYEEWLRDFSDAVKEEQRWRRR